MIASRKAAASKSLYERFTAPPFFSEICETARIFALREPLPCGIQDERVMPITRHRQTQKPLQKPVDMRRLEQIQASDDICNPLKGIIHNDRDMVACPGVLPRDDHISQQVRRCCHAPGGTILPKERTCHSHRCGNIKPPTKRSILLWHAPTAACPGIKQMISLRRASRGGRDLRPGAPAFIGKTHTNEPSQRCIISGRAG